MFDSFSLLVLWWWLFCFVFFALRYSTVGRGSSCLLIQMEYDRQCEFIKNWFTACLVLSVY